MEQPCQRNYRKNLVHWEVMVSRDGKKESLENLNLYISSTQLPVQI